MRGIQSLLRHLAFLAVGLGAAPAELVAGELSKIPEPISESLLDELDDALGDDEDRVRVLSLLVLDTRPSVRESASGALARFLVHAPAWRQAQVLSEWGLDGCGARREVLATALGFTPACLGARTALSLLLSDEEPAVVEQAAKSLARLTGISGSWRG